MSRNMGLQKGRQMAIQEYCQNGQLSLNKKSLIHFANGMCHFSMWINSSTHNDVFIDEFIEGFIEGYTQIINKYCMDLIV